MNVVDKVFWQGKKVFITGHTGFKGTWLSLWLLHMGAEVSGYALEPTTAPNLFSLLNLQKDMSSTLGDVRDLAALLKTMKQEKPDIVIHMAAQPLVRYSYQEPIETYAVNVMGTVNVLEAIKQVAKIKCALVVTTDKCYENREWVWGYREVDPLGGYDPYSSSKACAEIVTSAYRSSFFAQGNSTLIASVRAGNVIGGGDWSTDRLIPDLIKGFMENHEVVIRNPSAIRPWQHVLEPLCGYLTLAQKLYQGENNLASAWNFGPWDEDTKPVNWIADHLSQLWGDNATWKLDASDTSINPHEAHYLKLDWSKARMQLNWQPRWDLQSALEKIVSWYKSYITDVNSVPEITLRDIKNYITTQVK